MKNFILGILTTIGVLLFGTKMYEKGKDDTLGKLGKGLEETDIKDKKKKTK